MPKPVPIVNNDRKLNSIERGLLEGEVIESMRTVYDPELPVNIYDLGLIYDVQITEDADVHVQMTLTSPACPVAGTLPGEVEVAVRNTQGVRNGTVELVWDPPFTIDRIPEHIQLELGLM